MSRCSTQRDSTIFDAIALASDSMAMNLCHRLCCSSNRYFKAVEDGLLPWVLGDVDLGDNVLEIGPGYGANIRVLIDKTPHYTAVEIDPPMADRLRGHVRRPGPDHQRRRHRHRPAGRRVQLGGVFHDAAPCSDAGAAGPVVRRGVPGAAARRRLRRQRQCGVDPVPHPAFSRHLQPRSPETLPERLRAAGFTDVHVDGQRAAGCAGARCKAG